MTPKVSIVIPVYNVERWLDGCMRSVLGQTLQEFEAILVDDGSTDGSGALCDKYALSDPRIKVIHKENEGAGPSRNRGIRESKGEYIYFPDADDWFEPTMLENLYSLAKRHDADMVACNFVVVKFDADNNEVSRTTGVCKEFLVQSEEECRNNAMDLFPTSTAFDVPWNKLYRRQVITDNQLSFRKLRRCQDAVFNLDFYNCCQRVVSTSKAYYYYRENTQALVWRKFPKDYIDIQIFYFQHLRQLMTEWGIYNGWVKEHYDTSFVISIEGCAVMCYNPNWRLSRKERKEYVASCLNKEAVRDFLPSASIRPDQQSTYRLIRDGKVGAIMRRYRNQRIKDRLRQNPVLQSVWRVIKKLKP